MPFIGNQPALSFTSFAKQDFTTSATTSYTLDNPVANQNELALFINFVRQEPTAAYTASGTSLTLTSATSSSDDMYCVFLGKAVQTVNPPNNSVGTSQLVDDAVTPSKQTALANPFASQLLHVRDEKAQDANGGTNSAGVNTRELNTVVTNEITGASLSSNQITLPAGTYYIEATVPAYRVNRNVGYLYNTTDSSITIQGIPAYGEAINGLVALVSPITGRFTISAQKVLTIRHWTLNSISAAGLGLSSAQPGTSNVTGIISIYTDVKIWRTA